MVCIHYAKGLLELFEKTLALKKCIEYALRFFPEIEDARFGRAARSES